MGQPSQGFPRQISVLTESLHSDDWDMQCKGHTLTTLPVEPVSVAAAAAGKMCLLAAVMVVVAVAVAAAAAVAA